MLALSKEISPHSLTWIGLRHADPSGRVFLYQDRYYRAVYNDSAKWATNLLEKKILELLAKNNLCPETKGSELRVRGYALTLATTTSHFNSSLGKQPFSTLHKAVKTWLLINKLLLPFGYGLVDGHIRNFAMYGSTPKWIDIGSIQPLNSASMGIKEFITSLFYPYLIWQKLPSLERIIRLAIENNGFSAEEYYRMGGIRPNINKGDRSHILSQMIDYCNEDSIEYRQTQWSNYTTSDHLDKIIQEQTNANDNDLRPHHFNLAISRIKPNKCIDLGSSSGAFSIRVARHNTPVLAVDTDISSLDRLSRFAIKNNLPITTHLDSALSLKKQRNVDLVVAMALSHHLRLSQFCSFQVIAKIFAGLTDYALITEFMPNGLGGTTPAPLPLPNDYNLEIFTDALKVHFRNIEVTSYFRPGAVRIQVVAYERI